MRLIDRLRLLTRDYDDYKVILADDILWGMDTGTKKNYHNEDFPNVAPPFEKFFIEGRERSGGLEGYIGMAFHVQSPDDLKHPMYQGFPFAEDMRWLVTTMAIGWASNVRRLFYFDGMAYLQIAADGTLLTDMLRIPYHMNPNHKNDPRKHMPFEVVGESLPFCLMTLSILHCKNVTLEESNPPEKLSRAHEKRHGVPLSKNYTLKIKPRVVRQNIEMTGESQSLKASHIARGHFKTYTEDAPLLGKHVGTYWWESQMRGHKEKGEISKRYDVHPPTNDWNAES